MATINLGVDKGYGYTADIAIKNKVKALLEEKGHTVADAGYGPNETQAYSKAHNADIMIQIANGKCIGTLVDFHIGTGTYYKPKKAGILYWKCWNPNWKIYRAKDDSFSYKPGIKPEVDKWLGKTMPEAFAGYDDMFYGYGDNAEDMVNTFLNNWNGTGGDTSSNNGSSSTTAQDTSRLAKDMIMEAINGLSDYGIEVTLGDNELRVVDSTIDKYIPLDSSRILANSVTITPYANHTPNVFIDKNGKKHRDEYLIQKNGEVEINVDDFSPLVQALKQRDYGHKIDMKILADPNTTTGRWIKLNIPEYGIKDRMYYLTKLSYVENSVYSITLEPAPPKREYQASTASTASTSASTDNQNNNTTVNKGAICSRIEKAGGIPITDWKTLYENFKKFHYKYYKNDIKSREQALRAIETGGTCNCVDFAQIYHDAYKEAGFPYPIRFCNGYIYCRSTYGHVWCQVQIDDRWIHVDPSGAAQSKRDIGQLICGTDYKITSVNSGWIKKDDGIT